MEFTFIIFFFFRLTSAKVPNHESPQLRFQHTMHVARSTECRAAHQPQPLATAALQPFQFQILFLKKIKCSWQKLNYVPYFARFEIQPLCLTATPCRSETNIASESCFSRWRLDPETIERSFAANSFICCWTSSVLFNPTFIKQLIFKRFGLWTRDAYRVKHFWCTCHLQTGIPRCATSDA